MAFLSYFLITVSVVLLVFPSNSSAKSQPGLFDRGTFPSVIPKFNLLDPNNRGNNNNQNNRPNVNLISLFPQNTNVVPTARSQLDPETREEVLKQKEQLEVILQGLKELNKKKEEANKKPMGNTGYDDNINTSNNNDYDHNNVNNNNNINSDHYDTGDTHADSDSTRKPFTKLPSEPDVIEESGWQTLTVDNFMFQAQPVRPEPEIEKSDSSVTLFYVQNRPAVLDE